MKKLKFLLATILMLCLSHSHATKNADNRQQLKNEIINEIVHSETLRQKIADEIRAYDAQKMLAPPVQITRQLQNPLRPVLPTQDHIYGNPEAAISVVEFSDFECAYCRKVHPVLKRLVDGSEGQINWIFRHFPLSSHQPNADQEAMASECVADMAGASAFWKFAAALFQQPRRAKPDSKPIIDSALEASGFNKDKVSACISSAKFQYKVDADENEALSLGLKGTPANVLVNHKTGASFLRQGAASLETLQEDAKRLQGNQQ